MKQDTAHIDQLIKQLKANDKVHPAEVEEDPSEPKEAMEELAKIGQPVVVSLIKILEDPSIYSCLYAIKVLGQIAAPEAAKPILDAFTSERFLDAGILGTDFRSDAYEALQKIGRPALEPILAYLKERREQKDGSGILDVLEILKGIKDEKTFNALVDLLNEDAIDKEYIIDDLVQYGDPRAIEHLKKLVKEDLDDDERRGIFEAIRDLAPVDIEPYRDMIAPYVAKDISKLSAPIHSALSNLTLAHQYKQEFEGDNAEEFNRVILSYKIQESIDDLLGAVFELGSYEGILPNQLLHDSDKLSKIRIKWYNFKEENDDIIRILDNRFPEDCHSQVTKKYKGLAISRYESGPKIAQLEGEIKQWLKQQDFSISIRRGEFWCFNGAKGQRQGCLVTVSNDGDKRSWGKVYLGVWGNGWTEDEASSFNSAFWNFTEKSIAELLGTKKLRITTINHE
jgi:HEAT repeat protein